MYIKSIFSCLVVVTLLGGCVVGTRNVGLDPPDFPNEKDSEGLIYIDSIEDNRRFEANPSVASIPSVDGDLSTTSKEKLSTLIGRQRSGFGKAMGDVALPEGGTVQEEVRELLTVGLESRGFIISDDKNAQIKLDVSIEQFWGWFTPGFATISFEAKIECILNFAGTDLTKEFHISGYGMNKGQIASNANWKLTYQKALYDFLVNLDKTLDDAGF